MSSQDLLNIKNAEDPFETLIRSTLHHCTRWLECRAEIASKNKAGN